MAQVVVVTSGKGGVGKTPTTAALGAGLAQSGQRVVVVDFDVGLRNLELVMGAERRVPDELSEWTATPTVVGESCKFLAVISVTLAFTLSTTLMP
jgi:septum formation inhibitor-activating ATPase MinD